LVNGVIVPEHNGSWIEFAGGYSDMLAQRGADLRREKPEQSPPKVVRKTASVVSEPPPAKRRLMFKDKHALETLPKTIAALQAQTKELQAKLNDPQFYARDRAGFEKVTATLGELEMKIAAAEEQWLELEILREDIAGG
jgi:ABC transport system ATP-binding/permease protein